MAPHIQPKPGKSFFMIKITKAHENTTAEHYRKVITNMLARCDGLNPLARRLFTPLINMTLTLALSFFLAQAAQAAQETLLHKAVYEGSYKGLDISMTRTLKHISGERYKLETRTDNFFGKIVEYEEFLWTESNKIYPLYYRYKQRVLGISKKRSISYDWQALTATSKYKKKKRTLPIHKGVLGPMTYQLMFQIDLIEATATPPAPFDYQFVRRGELKRYTFSQLDNEKLQYKKQSIAQASAFIRMDENKKKQTKIWFDPDNRYTLSALQQTKDKKVHNLFLTSSQYFPATNSHAMTTLINTLD